MAKFSIYITFEVNAGDYWRDQFRNRWLVQSVDGAYITALSEIDSIPRKYKYLTFYKLFVKES